MDGNVNVFFPDNVELTDRPLLHCILPQFVLAKTRIPIHSCSKCRSAV